jgi:uncharacterized damage-inducible protein DinB
MTANTGYAQKEVTMNQGKRFADQLERSFRGGAWHGLAVTEALAGVEAATAAARPVAAAHSIWEIVHHLTVWNEAPRRRLDGESLQDLPAAQDWPAVGEVSPDAWRAAQAALAGAHAALHERVLSLADSQLEDPVAGSDPTVQGMLLGVLQHNAYHAGQIVLLRKAAMAARP